MCICDTIYNYKGCEYMEIKLATTQTEFFSLMRVRVLVFMKEQNVDPSIECDKNDQSALHFIYKIDNEVIATCRVLLENGYHLGRIAVLKQYRKQGIGAALLRYVEQYAKQNNIHRLELGAQLHAVSFYENCGFQSYGEIFEEADIQHIMMEKHL